MLTLLFALSLAAQPAVSEPGADARPSIVAQADQVDATLTAANFHDAQIAYQSLAQTAGKFGDPQLMNAMLAKAAFAKILQRNDGSARLTLIDIVRNPASTAATRSFANQLLKYINQDRREPLSNTFDSFYIGTRYTGLNSINLRQ